MRKSLLAVSIAAVATLTVGACSGPARSGAAAETHVTEIASDSFADPDATQDSVVVGSLADLLPEVTDADFDTRVLTSREDTVVMFTAPWCKSCEQSASAIAYAMSLPLGATYLRYGIDVEVNQDFRNRYGITGIPVFLAFRDGEVIGKHVGQVTGRQLSDWLGRVL